MKIPRSPMNVLATVALLSTCLGEILVPSTATPDDLQVKSHVLNEILTTNDGSPFPRVAQQMTCGATSFKTFGIFPVMGSEMGGTPVAVAFQMDDNDSAIDASNATQAFDPSMLSCKFGETVQPALDGPEVDAQLERISFMTNSSVDVLFEDDFHLLVCLAPPYPKKELVPGPLSFSISCKTKEEETIQESTLSYEFTIESSVYSITPTLGQSGTKVEVKGSGFRNTSSLMCFFGQHGATKAEFGSSDVVLCTAPSQGEGDYPVVVSNNGIDFEGEWAGVIFSYVPLPIVESLQPQTITWMSDANVSVTGKHFAAHVMSVPVCSFGENMTSPAVVESDDQIVCPLPTMQGTMGRSPFISKVRVSTNGGIDFSVSSSRVFVYQPVELHSVLPNVAPEMGCIIALQGANFHPSQSLSCWFLNENDVDKYISVPATYSSSSKIECQTPQSRVGNAKVWVSTNNKESGKSLNSLGLKILGAVSLISANPLAGALAGGTSVIVEGTNFVEDPPIVCRFGAATVKATVFNSTHLSCNSPPALAGISFESWRSSNDAVKDVMVSLELSSNGGLDLTESGTTFQYFEQVLSSSPNIGPQFGGTRIVFHGNGIGNVATMADQELQCEFFILGLEDQVPPSPITFIDEDSMSCVSPSISSLLAPIERSRIIDAHVKIFTTDGNEVTMDSSDTIFSFYPEVTLTKLHPSGGTNLGGRNIIIEGEDFARVNGLKCLFNDLESLDVQWISPSRISCKAPEAASRFLDSLVNVTLAINDGEMLTTDILQFVHFSANIQSFSPTFASFEGGTYVHIHGSGFDQIQQFAPKCFFSDESTIATVLSRNLIKCALPKNEEGEKTVTITIRFNGGTDDISTDKPFTYVSPATIEVVTPKYIPSDGGTEVVFQGSNFLPKGVLSVLQRCSFGGTVVAASTATSDMIICHAPPMKPGTVEVAMSINGVDFTTHGEKVTYHPPAEIHEVNPPFASETGGQVITVKGTNFQPSPDLSCIFSDVSSGDIWIAPATFESETQLICTVPLRSGVGVSSTSLEISNSKEPHPDVNPVTSFQYHQMIQISSVRQDSSIGGKVILEADGFHSLQEGLKCCFMPVQEDGSKPPLTRKAQIISPKEVMCDTPTFDDGANNISISLGIMHNGVFYDMTDPQAEPVSFLDITDISPELLTSDEESEMHGFGQSFSVEPIVVSEFGGSTISIVSSDFMEMNRSVSCIFSHSLSGLTKKSAATFITKHVTYNGNQQFVSNLLTCQAPKMSPGEYYMLSLESTQTKEKLPDIARTTVHPAFSITGFEPISGPSSGGTTIKVLGSNFPNTTELSCRVGNAVTQAEFLSPEMIQCVAPPMEDASTSLPSSVNVFVSANGQDFEEFKGLMFSYILRPDVSGVFPAAGQEGTQLTIHGKNLLPNEEDGGILVSFDKVVVPGIPLNETAVACTSPPMQIGEQGSRVSIRVSTNGGHDFSHSSISYSYHKLRISYISPQSGPELGGNQVTIFGSGFTPNENDQAACRFGRIVTPASVISEKMIECIAPKSVAHSVVDVALTIDGGVEWSPSNTAPGTLTYRYLPMIEISEIIPSALSTNVPHTIHITGENFQYPSVLTCKVGATISSKAVIVDDNLMKCFIPPIHHLGEVMLDIVSDTGASMLDLDRSSNALTFFDPIDFRITPSFGNIRGGTTVMVALEHALSIDTDLLRCRFVLSNEQSFVIDVIAVPLNSTLFSCTTPNVTSYWSTDDHVYSTVFLISLSEESNLPLSLSGQFMFKPLPVVRSIRPGSGSSDGGTTVRVQGGDGIWLNSSRLECYFGQEKGEAIWISPLLVDCISPPDQNISEVILSVSDNEADKSISTSTFKFHPLPVVTSVEPKFGLASNDNVVTFTGYGFFDDEPTCIFVERHGGKSTQVKGVVINETTMECHVASNTLAPADYTCKASNNGGIESGPLDGRYTAIYPPTILSLTPQSGMALETISVAVIGSNLALEGPHDTHCVLLDNSGSQIGSSLAERVGRNTTSVNCPVSCPSHNVTTKYSLGILLADQVHTSSVHNFWCDPRPSIVDLTPKFIGVQETTLIRINMAQVGSANLIHCTFEGSHGIITSPAKYITGGTIECSSPIFPQPERVKLSVSLNNHTLTEDLPIEVVDPISIYSISPKAMFSGTNITVKGSNFVPGKMNCTIAGSDGVAIFQNESHVVCHSLINMDANPEADVVIGIDEAPQLNAIAGIVDILPTPTIKQITPSSGVAHGGLNVIIRGINFHAIGNPWCYFGDIAVKAFILTNTSISCVTPKSGAGKVQVQVSLDDGNTIVAEDQFFTFYKPIILHEVYPRTVINGTRLRVRGKGFGFDLPIKCAFGEHHAVPAMVLSSTEATCVFAPTTRNFGQVTVSIVTSDGIPASIGIVKDASIWHQPPVEIYSAVPLYGSAIGGKTTVELQVSGLSDVVNEDQLYCNFEHKVALATMFNESMVACTAPAAYTPGNVSLSLSLDGLPLSSNSLTFEYTAEPKVVGFSPTNGPYSGGTQVRIWGINLMPRGKVSCRFGHDESYGYLDTSDGSIYCLTPPVQKRWQSRKTLYLKLDEVNGWVDTGMDFHFVEPIILEEISPIEINYETEYVQVKGQGFSRGMHILSCVFGDTLGASSRVSSEAIILSNTTIKCPLPKDAIKDPGQEIPLSITSNGVDYASGAMPLTHNGGQEHSLSSLSPALGPAFGNTLVDIRGSGFQSTENLTCWFNSVGTF